MVIASNTRTAPILRSHRFFEEAPETISLPLAELLTHVPAQFLKETPVEELNGRTISLPCRDLLAGNTPRLSLGQLNDLLPELVVVPAGEDGSQRLNLPAGWLALHYRLVTRFEEILPEKQNVPALTTSLRDSLPAEESEKKPSLDAVIEAEVISTKPVEDASRSDKQNTTAVVKNDDPEHQTLEEVPISAPKRGFFASLPIFRRNTPVKRIGEEHGLAISITPVTTTEDFNTLAIEPLWKLDPLDPLNDPSALQALFMTEETLTVDRVIAMAGELPGLRACILAHGDKVVCASKTPPGIDLQTLSCQAMTMLAQIRDSSSKMGLGNVPGVTLHAEQGALSFLHNKELCLLVLHSDRGFLPGVRERLQEMLGLLSLAESLPSGSSAQPSLPL